MAWVHPRPDPEGLADIHEDIAPADFDWVRFYPNPKICFQSAAGNVVLPAVPWTSDSIPGELPLPQRSSSMEAYIVDCKQLTVYIRKSDGLAVKLELSDHPRGNFVGFRSSYKGHSGPPLKVCSFDLKAEANSALVPEGLRRATWIRWSVVGCCSRGPHIRRQGLLRLKSTTSSGTVQVYASLTFLGRREYGTPGAI